MKKEKMIRTQICLTIKERRILEKEANDKGISMAELIRRIVDEHLDKAKI